MTSNTPNRQQPENSDRQYLDEEFAKLIESILDKYHVSGTSVAVVDNGKVESAGYGMALLPNVPATRDTLYHMASTTKAQTAAIMGLILKDSTTRTTRSYDSPDGRRAKLKWTTPVYDVLGEDFDLDDEYLSKHVSIEDALSNRTGLAGHNFNYGPWQGDRLRDLTRSLRYLGPVYQPLRSRFQYCNLMFAVTGDVIQTLEGKSFGEIAKERLWGPLGMNDTFHGLRGSEISARIKKGGDRTLARGYFWVGDTDQKGDTASGHYVTDAHFDIDIVGPAAAVVSSVNDYAKWISALLSASQPPAQKKTTEKFRQDACAEGVISHELWNDLTTPRTIIDSPINQYPDVNPAPEPTSYNPPTYALGWYVGQYMYSGHTMVHHAGGLPGFGTHVFLLPTHNFGIAIAGNGGPNSNKVAEYIGRELVGLKIGISKDERRLEGTFAPNKDEEEQTESSPNNEAKATNMFAIPHDGVAPTSAYSNAVPNVFDAQSTLGVYEHDSYGKIEISASPSASLCAANPVLNNAKIIRKEPELGTNEGQPPSGSAYSTLHVTLLGVRSFATTLLLHQPTETASSSRTDYHSFVTLEQLWAHGSLVEDTVPGLPLGHGSEDDPKHPFKQEGVYESTQIISCGACFEHNSDAEVTRLGMILGNTESTEAEMRKGHEKDVPLEGWQIKMVWFVKSK